MGRVVDLGFGGGQFLCSGKGIALMEVCKVIPEVGFSSSFFLFFFVQFSFVFGRPFLFSGCGRGFWKSGDTDF